MKFQRLSGFFGYTNPADHRPCMSCPSADILPASTKLCCSTEEAKWHKELAQDCYAAVSARVTAPYLSDLKYRDVRSIIAIFRTFRLHFTRGAADWNGEERRQWNCRNSVGMPGCGRACKPSVWKTNFAGQPDARTTINHKPAFARRRNGASRRGVSRLTNRTAENSEPC